MDGFISLVQSKPALTPGIRIACWWAMDSASSSAARTLNRELADDEESARRRLVGLGASALSESELLSLICTGSAAELRKSIREVGGLRSIAFRPPRDSLGAAQSTDRDIARLIASIELARRILGSKEIRPRLRSPPEIYEHLRPQMALLNRESFHVLCFNARNVLIQEGRVAEGCVDSCAVDPREVFSLAVAARSTALVLAHNHPSGDAEPSARDLALTEQLVAGGSFLGIQILDHLILGDGDYTSLRERGWIRPVTKIRPTDPPLAVGQVPDD